MEIYLYSANRYVRADIGRRRYSILVLFAVVVNQIKIEHVR